MRCTQPVPPFSSCGSAFSFLPLWLPIGVIGSLSILLVNLRVLTLGPGIREQERLAQSPGSSLAHSTQALCSTVWPQRASTGAHIQQVKEQSSNVKSRKKAQSHLALSSSSLMAQSPPAVLEEEDEPHSAKTQRALCGYCGSICLHSHNLEGAYSKWVSMMFMEPGCCLGSNAPCVIFSFYFSLGQENTRALQHSVWAAQLSREGLREGLCPAGNNLLYFRHH